MCDMQQCEIFKFILMIHLTQWWLDPQISGTTVCNIKQYEVFKWMSLISDEQFRVDII